MIRKLLSAMALASVALAQDITITHPSAGTEVVAGSPLGFGFRIPAPPARNKNLGLAIVIDSCPDGCFNDNLGTDVLYDGPFNPKPIDDTGNEYQNLTVIAPNYFNGPMRVNVVYLYLNQSDYWAYRVAQEIVTTNLNVNGSTG